MEQIVRIIQHTHIYIYYISRCVEDLVKSFEMETIV